MPSASRDDSGRLRGRASAVGLAFFLSGFAALLFETLWVRLLALFCGSTTLAISAVLAAFMGGLALGSWTGGRLADRVRSPLALYALLEAGIALWGYFSKPAIDLLSLLVLSLDLASLGPGTQSAVYFSAALLVLLFPTTLMGATLPALTRWAASDAGPSDRPLGFLYGLNTLGAVCGAACAGFWLIPAWGLSRSLLLAGSCNALSAVLARAASRPGASKRPAAHSAPGFPRVPAAALFLAGAAGMACQIAWTRAFALLFGSSTYSFTIILILFLSGLAAGGLLFGWLRPRLQTGLPGLGLLLNAAALSVLAGLPAFNRLPYLFMRLSPWAAGGGWRLHALRLLVGGSVLGLPTILMGASFPWAVAAASPSQERLGRATGACYAANTLGAILGSIAGGLLLLPLWGAERTLLASAGLYAAAGLLAGLWAPGARLAPVLFQTAVLGAFAVLRPVWDPRVLSSGMFLYGSQYRSDPDYRSFLEDLHRDKVLFSKDGRVSTVAVLESPAGERYLRINGKTDASSGGDIDTQLLVGYLPRLFHPGRPRRALVIGFGAGASAAAAASDPALEEVDVAEIEPAVLEAGAFFPEANRRVLSDTRVRVFSADGRQFLAAPGPGYDLISSEPSNPWISGVANLYTYEAFSAAKRRLNEGGVFLQWFHSYLMGEGDFKMIMRTFSSVFPHTMLLWTGEADFFLMGSVAPWDIRFAQVERIFREDPNLRRDMAGAGKGWDEPLALLAGTFLLKDEEVRAMSAGAPIHRDDLPRLEFSAPLYLRGGEIDAILKDIISVKQGLLPEGLAGFSPGPRDKALFYALSGESLLQSGNLPAALKALERARTLAPASARVLTDLGRAAELGRGASEAARLYRKAVAADPNYAPARLKLGVLCMLQHRDREGVGHLEKGLALLPADPEGSLYLAIAYLERRRVEEAQRLLRQALDRPIADPELHDNLLSALAIAQQATPRSGG